MASEHKTGKRKSQNWSRDAEISAIRQEDISATRQASGLPRDGRSERRFRFETWRNLLAKYRADNFDPSDDIRRAIAQARRTYYDVYEGVCHFYIGAGSEADILPNGLPEYRSMALGASVPEDETEIQGGATDDKDTHVANPISAMYTYDGTVWKEREFVLDSSAAYDTVNTESMSPDEQRRPSTIEDPI